MKSLLIFIVIIKLSEVDKKCFKWPSGKYKPAMKFLIG